MTRERHSSNESTVTGHPPSTLCALRRHPPPRGARARAPNFFFGAPSVRRGGPRRTPRRCPARRGGRPRASRASANPHRHDEERETRPAPDPESPPRAVRARRRSSSAGTRRRRTSFAFPGTARGEERARGGGPRRARALRRGDDGHAATRTRGRAARVRTLSVSARFGVRATRRDVPYLCHLASLKARARRDILHTRTRRTGFQIPARFGVLVRTVGVPFAGFARCDV